MFIALLLHYRVALVNYLSFGLIVLFMHMIFLLHFCCLVIVVIVVIAVAAQVGVVVAEVAVDPLVAV